MNRQILSNATLILPNRATAGSLIIEEGRIADVREGRRYSEGLDLAGQFLIPGLIDMHTDYLEKEVNPRPSAEFPLAMAFHMMDLRAVGCGVTTVLGAARISNDHNGRPAGWNGDGLELARLYSQLRRDALARHYVHIRWNPNFEPAGHILAELLKLDTIGNVVYNDSTPGERQFRNIDEQIKRFAESKGIAIEEAHAVFEARRKAAASINNRSAVHAALGGHIRLGSHDDTTVEHVLEAHQFGSTMAEMPCSIEAARKAKELGMTVCMGAPNYYRGGSHCGNLGCPEAMAEGLVDILCSDFHFPALLGAALKMMAQGAHPSAAINLMSLHPARYLGLDGEIGSIQPGKKADLVAFYPRDGFGMVSNVWVEGTNRFEAGAGADVAQGLVPAGCPLGAALMPTQLGS
jgi:alpha-D-ribose 1-methylphosphonate 5-triphosphate diphosphatase